MSRRGGGGGRGRGGSKSALASSKELLKRSAFEAGLDDRHIKVLSDITRPPLFPDFLWKSTGHYWNDDGVVSTTNPTISSNANSDRQQHPVAIKTESPSTTTTTSQPTSSGVPIKKLPASMISMIHTQRELTSRFQNSSYYIRPNSVVDIVRYSDRNDSSRHPKRTPDAMILASLCASSTSSTNGNIYSKNKKNGSNPNLLASDTNYFPSELLTSSSRKETKSGRRRTNLIHTPISKKRIDALSSSTIPMSNSAPTAASVAIKLETLDHQEEEAEVNGGKIRTTSITSMTSNDDLMLTMPPPSLLNPNTRKSSEADEIIVGDIDDDDDDDDINGDSLLEENVEEELNEDYTTNYYASDDDNNNDDDDIDGEPIY